MRVKFFALSLIMCTTPVFPAAGETVVMRPKEGYCRYYFKRAANVFSNLGHFTSYENRQLKKLFKAVHKNNIGSSLIDVEIGRLLPVHQMSLETEKAQQRVRDLKAHSGKILESGLVDMSIQVEALSSKNAMRVIKFRDYYLITDGNGRLGVLESVFGDHPEVKVTVELLEIENYSEVEDLIIPVLEAQGFDTSDLGSMRKKMFD